MICWLSLLVTLLVSLGLNGLAEGYVTGFSGNLGHATRYSKLGLGRNEILRKTRAVALT